MNKFKPDGFIISRLTSGQTYCWEPRHLRNTITLKKIFLAGLLCWSLEWPVQAFSFLGPNPALHNWTVRGPWGQYGLLVWPSESKLIVGSRYYTVKGNPSTLGAAAFAVFISTAVGLFILARPLGSVGNASIESGPNETRLPNAGRTSSLHSDGLGPAWQR